MMKELQQLSQQESELLLKAPALVSLLAASIDGNVDEQEKAEAMKLSHLRAFTTNGTLQEYYKEVENRFKENFEQLNHDLPKDVDSRAMTIAHQMEDVENVLLKLDDKFARRLKHSLDTYKEHVSKTHQNAIEFFVLPLNFKGLTE